MKTHPRIDAAIKRLSTALDQLEAVQARRQRADLLRGDLEEELSLMQDDRARLAVELDAALARAKALDAANLEASLGLERAGTTLRTVLASIEEAGDGD
jgi:hypothetical protein